MDNSLLSLSLLVSTIIFFSIVLFGKIGPLVFVTTLSAISVLWGWVAPTENEVIALRILMLFASFIAIILNRTKLLTNIRNNLSTKIYPTLIINVLVILSALIVKSVQPKSLYELMFNGYDNYGHLAIFNRTFALNGFEYSPRAQIETPNVLAANGYPLLVHMVWSVILRLFNFQINNSDSLIEFFVYFSILNLLYLSYLVVLFILSPLKKIKRYEYYTVALLVLALICLAQVSTLVLQGFPPTLAGLIYTVSVYVLVRIEITPRTKWILLSSNVVLTGYSYQLFVPIAYLGLIAFAYSEFKRNPRREFYLSFVISHLALLLAAAPLIFVSKVIPSYLFAYGGIQTPSMGLLLMILFFNLGLLVFKKLDVTSFGYFFSTVLAAGLIAWAKLNETGYYYALKILYPSLLLGTLAGIFNLSRLKYSGSINGRLSSLATTTIASILMANQVSVFHNSTGIQILTNRAFNNPCVESQYDAVLSENVFAMRNTIFVYANAGSLSDLGTRQMNAINGRWDNDIFNFSIPYGQSENQEEYLKSYRVNNPDKTFLVFDYSQNDCSLIKRD